MNNYIKYLFFSISIIFTQVNTEAMRNDNLNEGLFNKIGVDLDYDNIDKNEILNLKLSYRLDYIKTEFSTFMNINFENGYNKIDGIKNTIKNKGFCHARYTKNIIENYFIETFIQYEFNDFLNIEDRYLLGLGTRIKFNTKNNNPIFLGIGIMNEKEIYTNDDDKNLIRSTNYLSNNTKINSKLTFSNIVYFQLDIADANDFRILYDGSINMETIENLFLKFGINYKYDNDPHENFSQSYTQLSTGIVYNF